MKYDPARQRRRSIRLKGYDYSKAGAYFVTIVTHNRACLFGEVVNEEMRLNELGEIVRNEWFRSAEIRREIQLNPDEFVVMPNHIHGIVWIADDDMVGATGRMVDVVGATGRSPLPPRSLASFIAGFKSGVTKCINQHRRTPGAPVWQRNYYEHIIRNEASLVRSREYIVNNPMQWALDRENPANVGAGLVPAQDAESTVRE